MKINTCSCLSFPPNSKCGHRIERPSKQKVHYQTFYLLLLLRNCFENILHRKNHLHFYTRNHNYFMRHYMFASKIKAYNFIGKNHSFLLNLWCSLIILLPKPHHPQIVNKQRKTASSWIAIPVNTVSTLLSK